MSFYTPLAASSNAIKGWIEYSKSNMQLFSDYGLSITTAVLNSLNLRHANDDDNNNKKDKKNFTNNGGKNNNSTSFVGPYSYYDNFLAISNSEFSKRLRSKDSLQHFKDHVDSIVNLESSIRQASPFFPPFSILYKFVDNYHLMFHNAVVSINETPYEVVRQVDATRLLRYYTAAQSIPSASSSQIRQNDAANSIPILMVYAPINRYHILDLSHERSIVQKFVSAGFDVFLLDWGERQSENKPTLADHIDYIEQSVEQIRKITKHEKVNLYGYSWGGTLSIIYAAVHNSKINNLVLQSANVDFGKDDKVIAEWMRNFPAERFVDEFKEMFGHFIDLAFLMRNPVAHSFDDVKYALETKEDSSIKFIENLVKIRSWINNTPDIPGPLFRQFAVDLYQQNLLIKNQLILDKGAEEKEETGQSQIEKEAVDLKNISVPILNIVGNKDDLVSSMSSIPITEDDNGGSGSGGIVSSKDKRLMVFPSEHIELCISYDAHKQLWPQVTQWLKERST